MRHLDWYSSDHRPICLRVDIVDSYAQASRFRRHFKFEEMWIPDDMCKDIVEKCWLERNVSLSGTEGSETSFINTIELCGRRLAEWGKKKKRDVFREIDKQNALLQDAYQVSPNPDFSKISDIERSLDKAMTAEEIYWKQRSRENWLKWGDRNTKWFHKRASFRRKKNTIHGVFNKQGSWVEKTENIEAVFIEYFKTLFESSTPDSRSFNEAIVSIPRCMSQEMNDHLLTPFSEEEIKVALFQMFPTKAPGPDGFPALFYQQFWNIVRGKTVASCLNILNNRSSVRDLNHTNIVLVPKIKHPKAASDFRPINLCNVSYKLIAKSIANRLKPILQSIISEAQSAFVLGRLISDNFLISYECVEYIMQKRSGKAGYVAMKLDMSKAYDRVEWTFLEK